MAAAARKPMPPSIGMVLHGGGQQPGGGGGGGGDVCAYSSPAPAKMRIANMVIGIIYFFMDWQK